MYIKSIDYLVACLETPLGENLPTPTTFGESAVMFALNKVLVEHDVLAFKTLFEMVAMHDRTLRYADEDD